jgi:hypothetical protein
MELLLQLYQEQDVLFVEMLTPRGNFNMEGDIGNRKDKAVLCSFSLSAAMFHLRSMSLHVVETILTNRQNLVKYSKACYQVSQVVCRTNSNELRKVRYRFLDSSYDSGVIGE